MSVCGALRSNSEFLFLDTHRDIADHGVFRIPMNDSLYIIMNGCLR